MAAAGPRYAPEDPTLPKPWRGLVDGRTGNLYFWNPVTNVTQYQRPSMPKEVAPEPDVTEKQSSDAPTAAVSSDVPETDNGVAANDVRHESSGNGGSELLSETKVEDETANGGSDYSYEPPKETVALKKEETPDPVHVPSAGSGLSPDAYRRKHEITVSGNNVPPPFTSFEETGFPSELLREVLQAGFTAPTPIQAQSWPIALRSRDVVAVAKTGSGKTLGYLIPGFRMLKVTCNNPKMGPTVLVLSPTRELATQIQDEAVKFGKSSKISCTTMNDILEMRKVNLSQVSYLVLDEADRMLDIGFELQIRKIINAFPTCRQTLMYTATWPKEVRKIAADLVNPVQSNIGNVDELVANKSITQHVEVHKEKNWQPEHIIRSQTPGSKIIIFCATKKMCDQLAHNSTRPSGAAAIQVLSQFRSGKSPVLVAIDVAARGLDVKDIRVVVNFDILTGWRIMYIGLEELGGQHVPQEIREMASRGGGGMGGGRCRRWSSDGGSSYGSGDGRSGGGYDSGYGERGNSFGGRGSDRDEGDGGYQAKSFHDSMGNAGEKRDMSRSPPNNSGSGWGGSRDSSRSLERFNYGPPPRSFHELMMERAAARNSQQ
ncbi:DEAD-box ATP-dependent RNA helicase 14-like protein [Tanacetum coccineum]